MAITVVYYTYYYSILETMILRVCFLVPACDVFDSFTSPPLVNEGDRVAQLIVERIYTPEISVVEVS